MPRDGEWPGNLGPDVIITVATGGAGGAGVVASRGTRAADVVADLADAARTADRLRLEAVMRDINPGSRRSARAGRPSWADHRPLRTVPPAGTLVRTMETGGAARTTGRTVIGRDREAAELVAGLEDALGGRGRLFLLAGEPGIGKTWLAGHLATHARERGMRVLWGRCWEGGGAPPLWPWAQIVRVLTHGWDDATLAELAGPGAPHLARMAPAVASRLASGRPAADPPAATPAEWADTDTDAARFHLFEATAALLSRAAAAEPLMLVLDDLHAADDASLLLLRFLTQDLDAARVLVVGTFRDTAERSGIGEALAGLAREAHLLRLAGLGRAEVHDLVGSLLGSPPAAAASAAIHDATGGNPLFVREAVRLLGTRAARPRSGEGPGAAGMPVPATVRAVIRQRLEPLDADAVQVLSAAAAVGRDIELPLLTPACDLPPERVLDALSAAAALGLVAEVPGTMGTWRFSHSLVREVLYEQLPAPLRVQLHRRVGEAIERVYGTRAGSHAAELSRHFAMVAATGEAGRALGYARQAGELAMAACAYEEAVTEYRRALHALTFAGPDEDLRCELLLRLGAALTRAGAYDQARDSHRQAADIARRLGQPERLARAALGHGERQVEAGQVNRELVALLREARDALRPDDSPLRARVLARLSLELYFADDPSQPQPDAYESDVLSAEAVAMARRLGDPATLGAALRANWMAAWTADGLAERAAVATELVDLAQATGDVELELLGRARQASSALESGDLRALRTNSAAHADLAEALRMPAHRWTAATLRAMHALLHGDLDDAEGLAAEAAAVQPDLPSTRFAHLQQMAALHYEQGRLGELRPACKQLADQFPNVPFARGWLVLSDADAGRTDDAREGLASLAEDLSREFRHGLWLPGLALASLAAARLEDPEAAERLYPLLEPYKARTIAVLSPHPVTCLGAASFHLALLAATASRWDDAAALFEPALTTHDRLAARPLLARTCYEYARTLVRRGRAADRRRAAELAERAHALAIAVGMPTLVEEVAGLAEEIEGLVGETEGVRRTVAPAAPEVVRTDAAGGNVFRREGDYWTVSFEGRLARVADSKGMRLLARLLAEPGREFLAVDLEAAEHPASAATPAAANRATGELTARADLGDAGELLDATAKAAYKARLDELREEITHAEAAGDAERAARARTEIDFLTAELSRAVGLGGRDRRAAAHAERARLNVTRAIRSALTRLKRANPALGRHLTATLRTGRYCAYMPDPRAPIEWER